LYGVIQFSLHKYSTNKRQTTEKDKSGEVSVCVNSAP